MLLYFLRIIQCFLMKYFTVVHGIILALNTLWQCPQSTWGYVGVCTYFSRYLFIILSWRFVSMSPSCLHLEGVILEYFGAYFRILHLLFENHSICFREIFCIRFWVFFFIALHYVFHIPTLLGSFTVERSVGRYFWAHLGKRLRNTSKLFNIFSWNFLQALLI